MSLRFYLNDEPIEVDGLLPTTTVLNFVRQRGLTGTKEGCAEGDCGACSVAVLEEEDGKPVFRAVNSCLLMLPMVAGRRLYTIEGLRRRGEDGHPVQRAMVDRLASQCGYCTPGIAMSLFEACYREDLDEPWKLEDQLCGNLCRCTGYRPIREAGQEVAGLRPADRFSAALEGPAPVDPGPIAIDQADHGWRRPTTWAELAEAQRALPQARFINGGTDLALTVTRRFEPLPQLIDVSGLPGMNELTTGPDVWRIGAGVRLSRLERVAADEGLPVIARMLRFFASRQIKNRATIGGNLCNASPIGDLPPVLMALEATLELRGPDGVRRVGIDDWLLGYRKTALRPGELLAAIEVPVPSSEAKLGAYKLSRRRELDISAVAAGFLVELDAAGTVTRARLAYGGMAATTARARSAEAALLGQPWSEASVEAAAALVAGDFTAMSDPRGSSVYRERVAANLLRGFYAETEATPFVQLGNRPASTLSLGPARPEGALVSRSQA